MKDIIIKGSRDSYIIPSVNFNYRNGICELSGESFLEETAKFYSPLLEWIREYTTKVQKPIVFIFKLTYFNTSTSKCILDFLHILKKYEDNGGDVVVNWHYYEDDVDMQDDIEDYIIDTGIKINLFILD